MGAGKYRHRITIQRPVNDSLIFFGHPMQPVDIEPRDTETGEVKTVLSNVATLWAEVIPEQGSKAAEVFASNKETVIATVVMRTRYRKDVDASMRVIWQGRTYQIHAVSDVEGRGRELQVVCSEVF